MQAKQTTPERQHYSIRKAIEAVKEAVRIEDVASQYTVLKLAGAGRLLGRCIAPDHEDRTPSMTVYTDSQRFRCYGCGLGGDVVDLEEIGGRHIETWTAVLGLAERYGIELPRRPERWHQHQDEKVKIRDAIAEARKAERRRRIFKYSVLPGSVVEEIEDPEERREAAARMWSDFEKQMRRIGA